MQLRQLIIMKKQLILFLFLISLQVFSQTNLNDTQIQDIKKNILTYRIRYSDNNNYNDIFPDCQQSLKLEFEKLKDTFKIADKKWIFYKVINDNFSFTSTDGRSGSKSIFSHGIPEYYRLSTNNLIAINEKSELVYLGGNFFKTSIADCYHLSMDDYELFEPFLRIKLFNYDIGRLKLVKKRKTYLLFEAYSKILLKKIKIRVNNRNFDDIAVF